MLTKSHPAIKEILAKPEFKGATILARGGSSLVLDHGDDSVTKLTIDEMGYGWLTAGSYGMNKLSDDNPYKIPVLEDYDEVGVFLFNKKMDDGRIKCLEYGINAVRVQKLTKMRGSVVPEDQRVRHRFLKKIFNQAIHIQYTPDSANYFHKCAEAWIAKHPDDRHFEELLLAIYYMCADYHARPDMLTGGNVLMYNGHLALIDPVFDPQVWANMHGKYKHHFDNPQGNRHAIERPIQA